MTKIDPFTKVVIAVFVISALSLLTVAYIGIITADRIPDAKTDMVIYKNSTNLSVTLQSGTHCLCTPEIYNALEVNQTYRFQGTFNWYTKDFTIFSLIYV